MWFAVPKSATGSSPQNMADFGTTTLANLMFPVWLLDLTFLNGLAAVEAGSATIALDQGIMRMRGAIIMRMSGAYFG